LDGYAAPSLIFSGDLSGKSARIKEKRTSFGYQFICLPSMLT